MYIYSLMHKRIGVALCFLLIIVLGCSSVIRYDPGYHEVQEETSAGEGTEDKGENSSNIINTIPESSVAAAAAKDK